MAVFIHIKEMIGNHKPLYALAALSGQRVMEVGGIAFNIPVLRPSTMVIDQSQRPILGTVVLKSFIIFAWLSIVVLILTGTSIAFSRIDSEDILNTTYGIVLPSKHVVPLIMVLLVGWVSFVLSAKLAPFAPKPDTIVVSVKTNLSLGMLVLLNHNLKGRLICILDDGALSSNSPHFFQIPYSIRITGSIRRSNSSC